MRETLWRCAGERKPNTKKRQFISSTRNAIAQSQLAVAKYSFRTEIYRIASSEPNKRTWSQFSIRFCWFPLWKRSHCAPRWGNGYRSFVCTLCKHWSIVESHAIRKYELLIRQRRRVSRALNLVLVLDAVAAAVVVVESIEFIAFWIKQQFNMIMVCTRNLAA